MKAKLPLSRDYVEFVTELKQRIASARLHAARAVSRDLILLYWDIGRGIVERQEKLGWGESVVDELSADLQESFPSVSGFSARNLRSMKQFYRAYSDPAIWLQVVAKLPKTTERETGGIWPQAAAKTGRTTAASAAPYEFLRQAVAEIPWGHHLQILNKVQAPAARLYYLRATANFGWTRNVLLNQIKAKAYERSLKAGKTHNFAVALPEHLAEQAEETLKSSYNLEFLGIASAVRERKLEARLIGRLREFILELGYGFCFIGQQHRLTLGRKEYFINLLFYHRFLKSLVAIELKVGPFEPAHAGQMDFYLNLLNEKERGPGDNTSIGIILCAEKDNLEVEFALKTKTNPIGVAEYHLTEKLPKELKGKLPTERQLLAAVKEAIEDKS
jgi:predicted nuclease of restriction endonuclease-like (RecB) superfamily